MYSQQTKLRKLRTKFTVKSILIVLVILIILVLPILFYYVKLMQKRKEFENKRLLFERLLYEYSMDRPKFSDTKVTYYTNTFHMDEVMLTPDEMGLDSEHNDWANDSSTFGELIKIVQGLMTLTISPQSSLYKNANIWRIVMHTIRVVATKLPTYPLDNKFPWGQNWYQFSITYPLFLVTATYMYGRLFKKRDEFMIRHLSSYIANYFKDPLPTKKGGMLSMGWHRDGPNAVMMAVPYTGGHLFMKTWSPKRTSMQYVKDYVTLTYVNRGNGFYEDGGTFVFHTTLRAFGYIISSYPDFVLMSRFFGIPNVVQAINKSLAKTEHPTIPFHFGPWFTRTSNQASTFSRFGKLGAFVLDHMRGVTFKTEQYTIGFNGQHKELCFYESDQSNYHWAQYWIFARRHMYKTSDPKIYRTLIPYYPGVWSYGRTPLDMRSLSTTTETYLPDSASCIICLIENEAIGFYNKYQMTVNGELFKVTELTLVTKLGIHCYYEVMPNINLVGERPLTLGIQIGQQDIVKTALNGPGNKDGLAFINDVSSFVYTDGSEQSRVKSIKISDPNNANNKLDGLYLEPHVRNGKASGGFSTIHSAVRYNELIHDPTINKIETTEFLLLSPDKYTDTLFLLHKPKQCAAVSIDMGVTFRKDIAIPKKNIDFVLEPGYTVANGLDQDNFLRFNIKSEHKYQVMFENANVAQI